MASNSKLPTMISKVIIDEPQEYNLKGRKYSDHNTFIININTKTKHLDMVGKSVWKINGKTERNKYKELMQNKIQNYDWKTRNSTEYTQKIHTMLHETASKSIGKYKISNNNLNNKQIQEAKKSKQIAKHDYQEKIKTKNGNLIQTALTQYVETQKNLRTIINDYITRVTEKKLQSIYKNGYNSKSYWNIIRQLRQNNVEDLDALKNDDGVRLFSEDEIKNYAHQYYKQLYSKHSLPAYEKEWSNYIENKIHIYQEN